MQRINTEYIQLPEIYIMLGQHVFIFLFQADVE